MTRQVRRGLLTGGLAVALLATVDVAAASNVAAGLGGDRGNVSVPVWLYAVTGGAVIGASGLMSMLVTDRDLIEYLHGGRVPVVDAGVVVGLGRLVGGALGLAGLGAVVVGGVLGPQIGQVNLGVLLVFVGARAGLTIVAYLVGNPWPAMDPWRRIASVLPTGHRPYPERAGVWPAVGGLFVLVYLEIVLPVTRDPALLASLVVGYTVYTLAGAVVFGPDPWFRSADPISAWFRFYGAVAPLQRGPDGLELRPYGSRLRDGDLVTDWSRVAFALLLVAELTFSGFVATPPGQRVVDAIVGVGVPSPICYLGLFAGLYAAFFGAYVLAARSSRQWAQTYLTPGYLGARFAAPLLAIAAGYHFAHYGGFFLTLAPTTLQVATDPLGALNPSLLVLPWWFGHVEAVAILLGHVLAVWVAHGTAIATFPGRLQAIRSQYPFVLLMVTFTMASLYIVSLPTVTVG